MNRSARILRVVRAGVALVCLSAGILPHAAYAEDAQAQTESGAGVVRLGSLTINGAFTRATLPNAQTGGGYLTITNIGSEPDRLLAVVSDAAAMSQLHEMAVVNGMMTMGDLKDGLEIPAGGTVTLSPMGSHIMFMGLKHPLVKGGSVPVTLTFEKAGQVSVNLLVEEVGAMGPGAGMQGH